MQYVLPQSPVEFGWRSINFLGVNAEITKCLVNGKSPSVAYTEPYSNFKIHPTATVHQHHQLMKKLDGALSDPPEHELIINLPPKVRIEPAVSVSLTHQRSP